MTEISVGCQVRLVVIPPYLKTAEPMPMLRPADLLAVGDEGTVLDRRPGGYWGVKFDRGAFLLDSKYLEVKGNDLVESDGETGVGDTVCGDEPRRQGEGLTGNTLN